jgi:hypothetical protein
MYALVENPPPRVGPSLGFIVHQVPARPFIRPVWEELGPPEAVKERVAARFARLLDGDFGEALGVATPNE